MKVEILFPEVGNLCGDLMNIRYLRQCCPELEVVETDLKSRPAFLEGGVDLVYMGSATEKGLELMVKALTPYREELAARVVRLEGLHDRVFLNQVDRAEEWPLARRLAAGQLR